MNATTPRDRLWRKRLNELSAVWPEFVSGHTRGLHKTRVASRRIREALPIVAVAARPGKVKKLNRKMRALTRALGPIRELDVELHLLDDRTAPPGTSDRALEIVRREIASRRRTLREQLEGGLPVSDVKRLLRKLERVADGKDGRKGQGRKRTAESRLEAEWRGVLATRMLRRAKRLSAMLQDAGPLYAPDRLHHVRIAAKKLRYALEIARDTGVTGTGPLLRVLKRHQERLGDLHDLQMLVKHVRETEMIPGVGSKAGDLAAYADSIERECRRLHAGFVEHRDQLSLVVRDVRQQIVPSVTMPPRRQARATSTPYAVSWAK